MDAAGMRKILSERYGINSDEELDEALRTMKPLNIAIFVTPLKGKEKSDEPKQKKAACR